MIQTSAVRRRTELAELRPEWSALHRRAAPGSPFEHPAWAETWATHYLPEGDLECIAVRDDADGSLIGFAPFYRATYSKAGLRATCIRPFGTGRGQALTEVVQILALPDRTQDVLRAVVQHLEALPGWNWAQLSIGPNQGWLVPQWLDSDTGNVLVHRNTRPCAIFDDLPKDLDALPSRLKRNVKESLRRCRNRSAKLGDMTFRCSADADEVAVLVPKLIGLHGMRSQMTGKVAHRDIFDGGDGTFLTKAAKGLAAEGLARVHIAEHLGNPVAALLVLSDGRTDYVSASGLDPGYWELSLNTMLIFEALTEAVRLQRTAMNLSTGPDIAKMRWTSTVAAYHDFAIVRSDRRSRVLYGAYAQATLALEYRQALHRNRTIGAE